MPSTKPMPSTREEVEALLANIPETRLPLAISTDAVHDLIRRMGDQSVLLSAHMVEVMIVCGLVPVDAVIGPGAPLKCVELAPGIVADTSLLGWDPTARRLLYQTATGGWRRLDRVFRWLSFGDDYGDAWQMTDPPPGSTAPCDAGWHRCSLELDTILEAVPLPISLPRSQAGGLLDCGNVAPNSRDLPAAAPNSRGEPSWTVVDVNGRWQLVDRVLGTRALFECGRDATMAADAALAPLFIAPPPDPDPGRQRAPDAPPRNDVLVDRFVWLDRYNADDPGD